MQSMPNPKPSDDPHDIVLIAPDAIRVAPADEEIESLLKEKMRAPSAPQRPAAEPQRTAEPQRSAAPDFMVVPPVAAIPPVDTTFRPTAVNDVLVKSRRRSIAGRLLRGVAALLLAACIGGAAMAWRYHGDAAQQMIAEWAPLFVQKSSQPAEKTGLTAPPVLAAAEVDAANASPAQPAPEAAPAAQTAAPAPAAKTAAPASAAPAAAAEAAAPVAAAASPDEPQSLETMARDIANASQQIEQLKASVEQLKASQQQLVAMVSEKAAAQNLRTKRPAPPPRPAAALAPARTAAPPPPLPSRPYRQSAGPIMSSSAAPLPPAAPTYIPRQVEPQAAGETLTDPELDSVPRPPMPLR